MERITVYHRGVPVTHYPLSKGSYSIGSHSSNDIVLAGSGVAERQLVVYRGQSGCWRARPLSEGLSVKETDFDPGMRIAVGQFAFGIEPFSMVDTPKNVVTEASIQVSEPPQSGMVGVSAQICITRMEIARLGPLDAPILVSGETGTGKELVARGLHSCSKRVRGPFIAVNCGGLTASLLEDTLFGHERGAFTGAQLVRRGVFEQANGGTLFLDEIGELPLAQQAALLRVLDDKMVRRLGSEAQEQVNFRLIAATNRDLLDLTEYGAFRNDLYHRIAALQIGTTPLRDRPEDVAPLSRHFLFQMASQVGERSLTLDAVKKLRGGSWPGNARELRNSLLRAAVMTNRKKIRAKDIEVARPERELKRQPFRLDQVLDLKLEELFKRHRGNVAAMARELGVPRTSLRDRLLRVTGIPALANRFNPNRFKGNVGNFQI